MYFDLNRPSRTPAKQSEVPAPLPHYIKAPPLPGTVCAGTNMASSVPSHPLPPTKGDVRLHEPFPHKRPPEDPPRHLATSTTVPGDHLTRSIFRVVNAHASAPNPLRPELTVALPPSVGTAFVVDPNDPNVMGADWPAAFPQKLIITAGHVLANTNTGQGVREGFENPAGNPDLQVVVRDKHSDLCACVLTNEAANNALPALPVAATVLGRGDLILGAGYGCASNQLVVVKGERTVANLVTIGNSPIKYIQTNAAINPGHSGGPAMNQKKEVQGVIDAKLADKSIEGCSLIIPNETWVGMLRQYVREYGKNPHHARPVTLATPTLAARFYPPAQKERQILKLDANSTELEPRVQQLAAKLQGAENLGVKVLRVDASFLSPHVPQNAIVVSVDDHPVNKDGNVFAKNSTGEVKKMNDIHRYLESVHTGDNVELEYLHPTTHELCKVQVLRKTTRPWSINPLEDTTEGCILGNHARLTIRPLSAPLIGRLAPHNAAIAGLSVAQNLATKPTLVFTYLSAGQPDDDVMRTALHAGSILQAVNGTPVHTMADLNAALETALRAAHTDGGNSAVTFTTGTGSEYTADIVDLAQGAQQYTAAVPSAAPFTRWTAVAPSTVAAPLAASQAPTTLLSKVMSATGGATDPFESTGLLASSLAEPLAEPLVTRSSPRCVTCDDPFTSANPVARRCDKCTQQRAWCKVRGSAAAATATAATPSPLAVLAPAVRADQARRDAALGLTHLRTVQRDLGDVSAHADATLASVLDTLDLGSACTSAVANATALAAEEEEKALRTAAVDTGAMSWANGNAADPLHEGS